MSVTRTGGFTIGFRRGWQDWQKDLAALIAWAKAGGFGAIDLGKDGDQAGKAAVAGGLRIGTVDLKEWEGMISPDAGKRKDAVAANAQYVKACSPLGAVNHFVVMLPENPGLARAENFKYMVESFNELAPALQTHHARVAIEGWPGPGALCCTPEGYRAFFKECPSKSMGINYDPSHLIRMGIDPLRFLREFASRVVHVHGKDTALSAEGLYEFGNLQPPTFAKTPAFGSTFWRYTLPGHGIMNWIEAFTGLQSAGYAGCVCVELEDDNFVGTEPGEKAGLLHSLRYLEGC